MTASSLPSSFSSSGQESCQSNWNNKPSWNSYKGSDRWEKIKKTRLCVISLLLEWYRIHLFPHPPSFSSKYLLWLDLAFFLLDREREFKKKLGKRERENMIHLKDKTREKCVLDDGRFNCSGIVLLAFYSLLPLLLFLVVVLPVCVKKDCVLFLLFRSWVPFRNFIWNFFGLILWTLSCFVCLALLFTGSGQSYLVSWYSKEKR